MQFRHCTASHLTISERSTGGISFLTLSAAKSLCVNPLKMPLAPFMRLSAAFSPRWTTASPGHRMSADAQSALTLSATPTKSRPSTSTSESSQTSVQISSSLAKAYAKSMTGCAISGPRYARTVIAACDNKLRIGPALSVHAILHVRLSFSALCSRVARRFSMLPLISGMVKGSLSSFVSFFMSVCLASTDALFNLLRFAVGRIAAMSTIQCAIENNLRTLSMRFGSIFDRPGIWHCAWSTLIFDPPWLFRESFISVQEMSSSSSCVMLCTVLNC